jgi:type IV pilus assembly protein PilC
MDKAPKKKRTFGYYLSLPFLGIFYIVDFFLKLINWFFLGLYTVLKPFLIFFEYVCLGCYYTAYVIFFPLIFIFGKLVDLLYYLSSKDKKVETINIEEYIPKDDENSEDHELNQPNKKPTIKEYFTNKYNDFYFVKKQKEKQDKEIRELIRNIQRNNYRSETPIVFKYVVMDSTGKKESNIFIAYSKLEVLIYLQNEGYKVLKIETSKLLNILYDPNKSNSYKFKNKDLIFWLTQLSTYLKAGIPLTQSMHILSKQMSKNRYKKRIFDSIIYYLTLGEPFSSALSKQGKTFPALLISMIKTAEATGKLEETLDDMANYYTDVENTRKSMISAMSYPAIISIFSVCVITFILLYIVPKFQDVYTMSGAEINAFTLALLNLSIYLKANIMKIILIFILFVLIIIILYQRVKVFRKAMQMFLMKLPLIGNIIIYKEINIFTKTFSSLLQNNVFITESMTLLSEVTNNEIYKEIMYKTVYYIAKGDKISTAFKDHWAIPDVAYYMIVTGESTGELAGMMAKVADYYQTEHKTIINSLKAFIEPALIIFLAVVVGGIVMAVILPMFGLYSQIQ